MRIPIPREDKNLIIFCMSKTAIGSIPANGSSRSINFGFVARHLAISTLLLSPPDREIAEFFDMIYAKFV